MNFVDKDITLETEGMGIVMYSPQTVKGIPEGYDYLSNKYSIPSQVAEHLKKGDMVGFCTGSGGNYILKVREGYPDNEMDEQYPISIRLGIDIQDFYYDEPQEEVIVLHRNRSFKSELKWKNILLRLLISKQIVSFKRQF